MASFNVGEFGRYCVAIMLPGSEPVPGCLVQGPDAPYVLSVFHPFEGNIYKGKPFAAYIHVPDEFVECTAEILCAVHDFVLFRLCTRVDRETAPVDTSPLATAWGKAYVMFGYSTCQHVDSSGKWFLTWSTSTGHISSSILEDRTAATSGGSVPGDSGGPFFSPETKKVIGMNIAVALVNPCMPDKDAARARLSPQGVVKPLWIIEDYLAAKTGRSFFGPGGVKAIYAMQPALVITGSSEACTDEVALRAPRRSQEILCTSLVEAHFEELFSPDLLDPYKY